MEANKDIELHNRLVQVVNGDGCRDDREYDVLSAYVQDKLSRVRNRSGYNQDLAYWASRQLQLEMS